jgi:hypothetical protein
MRYQNSRYPSPSRCDVEQSLDRHKTRVPSTADSQSRQWSHDRIADLEAKFFAEVCNRILDAKPRFALLGRELKIPKRNEAWANLAAPLPKEMRRYRCSN